MASSWRSTRSGIIACQAGALSAAPSPRRKVSASRVQADISPARVSTPRASATRSIHASVTSNSLRRSTTSASVPAGQADQEDRQAGGRLHECDQQRRRRERGHQPGRADALHPGADVGCDRGDPNRAKDGLAERAPGRSAGLGTAGVASSRGAGILHLHSSSSLPFIVSICFACRHSVAHCATEVHPEHTFALLSDRSVALGFRGTNFLKHAPCDGHGRIRRRPARIEGEMGDQLDRYPG